MEVQSFFQQLGRFTVRWRWPIVAAWMLVAVMAATLLPSLSSVVQNDNQSFLPASAPSSRAAVLAKAFGSAQQNVVLVVGIKPQGTLDGIDLLALERAAKLAASAPGAAGAHLIGVSPDRHAAEIVAMGKKSVYDAVSGKAFVDSVRATISRAALPKGLSLHLGGQLATAVAVDAQSQSNGTNTQLATIAFIIALLLVVFRSLLAPIVTLLPAFIVLTIAGPVIAETAHAGLQVSSVSQLLLIVLVLGAGTDYGLFLVFRLREELHAGRSRHEAVVVALARVGESITFSAATVIAALLTLLLASFGLYTGLGAPLAIGIALMLLAGLTLLPALLAITARPLFWPSNPVRAKSSSGLWGRVAARVVRHPVATLAVGIIFFGSLAVASIGNRPSGFGGAVSAPTGSDAAVGNAALAAHFPAASANPTSLVLRFSGSVWANPTPMAKAEEKLRMSKLFKSVVGPFNPAGSPLAAAELVKLHSQLGEPRLLSPVEPASLASKVPIGLYESFRGAGQLISPNGHTVLIETQLSAGDPSATPAIDAVPALRSELASVAHSVGASQNAVAGEAAALYDVNTTSSGDLIRIVPIAALAISILLAILLRSLVAPLYLIASVVLSYLAALGVAVVLFIDIGGSGGLTFILPFLMFVFLLALGEDYNILVMSRIREEATKLPLVQAVPKAVGLTGSTITSAGLVLAGTFGVLATFGASGPGGSEVRDIGVGLAVGVLMDTFLVRSLLVPSMVTLLGRWNWWPSALSRVPSSRPMGVTTHGDRDAEAANPETGDLGSGDLGHAHFVPGSRNLLSHIVHDDGSGSHPPQADT